MTAPARNRPKKSDTPALNTMGGDRPRNDHDFYATPQGLADAICARLRATIGQVDLVVEPSAGAGPFVRAAAKNWKHAKIVAIERRTGSEAALIEAGADLAIDSRWEDVDEAYTSATLIVGNPPYNLPGAGRGKDEHGLSQPTTAERHVTIALDRLGHGEANEPQPRWLAFLLRQSFAATPARHQRLFAKGGLRYRWTVVGRPSFTGEGTDGAEYELFVWQAGFHGTPESGWLTWE